MYTVWMYMLYRNDDVQMVFVYVRTGMYDCTYLCMYNVVCMYVYIHECMYLQCTSQAWPDPAEGQDQYGNSFCVGCNISAAQEVMSINIIKLQL